MLRLPLLTFLAALILVLAPGRADAAGTAVGGPSGECLAAIAAAERHHGTPPGLLAVIAKVESGRAAPPTGALQPWPWTVDADGQGAFFATKDQAVTWSRDALAAGTVTFLDVGCMQIDLRMHPEAFADLEQAFDPMANADYGARFLRQLHDGPAGGNWFEAVGMYHSRTPILAAGYRAAVTAVAAGLPPPRMSVGHLSLVRLDLVGGGSLRLNAHKQPGRARRTLSPCQISAILGSYMPRRVAGCGVGGRVVTGSAG